MFLKFSTVLLTSVVANLAFSHRSLQAGFIDCIMGGGDLTSCCIDNASHEVCTFTNCVNAENGTLNDGCECGAVADFCASGASAFSDLFPGFADMCASNEGCCSSESIPSNDDYHACMMEKFGKIPDYSAHFQGNGELLQSNSTADDELTKPNNSTEATADADETGEDSEGEPAEASPSDNATKSEDASVQSGKSNGGISLGVWPSSGLIIFTWSAMLFAVV